MPETYEHVMKGRTEARLRVTRLEGALLDMIDLHNAMMKKIDHAGSFYDAETIEKMNTVPTKAKQALMP